MRSLSVSELSELYDVVSERMNEVLLPALTRANRTDELETLLTLLGLGELVGNDGSAELGPMRVLVLGATEVKEPKLRSIARKNGADPSLLTSSLATAGSSASTLTSSAMGASTELLWWAPYRTVRQASATRRAPSPRCRRDRTCIRPSSSCATQRD